MVLINGSIETTGSFNFTVVMSVTETGIAKTKIEGVFLAPEYFEEILSISSDRYELSKIVVHKEEYASEDKNILYHFTAGIYKIRT